MGCRQSNAEQSGAPLNVDLEVRKKFITGTYITHVAGGVEETYSWGITNANVKNTKYLEEN